MHFFQILVLTLECIVLNRSPKTDGQVVAGRDVGGYRQRGHFRLFGDIGKAQRIDNRSPRQERPRSGVHLPGVQQQFILTSQCQCDD